MFDSIATFWNRISLLGLEDREIEEYKKVRVILANRMSFLGPFMAIPLIFLWNKFFPLSIIVILYSLLLPLTLYFNYKGYFTLSRLWLITTTAVVVLLCLSFFPMDVDNFPGGGRILAFAMSLSPLFYFSLRERNFLIVSLIITIGCYLLWYVLNPIINIEGLGLTVSYTLFDIISSMVAFATLILQFFFIEEFYDKTEERIINALKEAQEKTFELTASQEELKRKNEEIQKAYEDLRKTQEDLKQKNLHLEQIRQELEKRQQQALIEQMITSRTKEYDDLARQFLDKDIYELTDAFLAKLATEFKIGKIILAVFYPTETPYILNVYGASRELVNTELKDSLLRDACINNQEWFLDLSENYDKNLLFIETGIAKVPAKAIWILPITYQNIVIAGMEMIKKKKPEDLTIQTIKSIVNSFATVLFYKLEREKNFKNENKANV